MRYITAFILVACFALPTFAQNSNGQTDTRVRKDIPAADQIKLLKAHDQLVSAHDAANEAAHNAKDAAAEYKTRLAVANAAYEEVKKRNGCVDFDATGDAVKCIIAPSKAAEQKAPTNKPDPK
jgi:hypothetical protein